MILLTDNNLFIFILIILLLSTLFQAFSMPGTTIRNMLQKVSFRVHLQLQQI